MNNEELIERLEGDSSGPYYDARTSFELRREAAQALREQQDEIERLREEVEELRVERDDWWAVCTEDHEPRMVEMMAEIEELQDQVDEGLLTIEELKAEIEFLKDQGE